MKKSVMFVLCILTGMLLVASMAMATSLANAGNGIAGSEHDLSSLGAGVNYGDPTEQGNADGGNRICIYCHAPHHTLRTTDAAADGILYLPLWNHAVTTMDYAMYSNGSEIPADIAHASGAMVELAGKTKPGGVSRLCLSCHDGTVSTNSYGFTPAPARSVGAGGRDVKASEFLIGGPNGNDLTNHHPIGFNYRNVQANDDELAGVGDSLGAYTIGDLLWQDNMECTTCHDVHNTKNTGERFLWTTDQNSAFCGACHLKL